MKFEMKGNKVKKTSDKKHASGPSKVRSVGQVSGGFPRTPAVSLPGNLVLQLALLLAHVQDLVHRVLLPAGGSAKQSDGLKLWPSTTLDVGGVLVLVLVHVLVVVVLWTRPLLGPGLGSRLRLRLRPPSSRSCLGTCHGTAERNEIIIKKII